MAYRFTIIVAFFLLAFTYLGFHLYQLQLVKGDYYYAQAESEQSAAASNNSKPTEMRDADARLAI